MELAGSCTVPNVLPKRDKSRAALHLTLLAPDIIERMMAGKQPRRLTLMWFQRNRLTVDWQAQRELMASFEGEG
ncbi:hypothetical protein [Laribacter hongkongensis]|uniref:hypothetical protein n=1 Tax=Laribacter hongkongensis TaxID=168471 RepID=UPI001EFD175A|nr:hypothetical protein [Laribacter hongkongensis]MCG9086257.1 hypothetical protein [Laribacter hongkongensis]